MSTDAVTFVNAVPKLLTRDLARTADYYSQHLGFEIVNMYGDYLILRRGETWLHFGLADVDPKTNMCSTYVYVRGVDALYEQCKAAGILWPDTAVADRPYGVRDFSLVDPDGNLLTFGERTGG